MANKVVGAAMQGGSNMAGRVGPLAQMGLGFWQMKQYKKMKDELGDQPMYETPDALTQGYDTAEAELKKGFGGALSSAQNRAVEGLPYAIRKNFQERMGQQTASALEFSGKRARGLAGLRDILSANQQGSNTLLDAEAAAKLSAQKDVEGLTVDQGTAMSGLAQDKGAALGAEEEKAFFLNQYNPFMQNKGEMQAMQAASQQNVIGGTSELADRESDNLQSASDTMMSNPFSGG